MDQCFFWHFDPARLVKFFKHPKNFGSIKSESIWAISHMLHVWYIYVYLPTFGWFLRQMLGFIFQHHGAYGYTNTVIIIPARDIMVTWLFHMISLNFQAFKIRGFFFMGGSPSHNRFQYQSCLITWMLFWGVPPWLRKAPFINHSNIF